MILKKRFLAKESFARNNIMSKKKKKKKKERKKIN